MKAGTQGSWLHTIKRSGNRNTKGRINITFRQVKSDLYHLMPVPSSQLSHEQAHNIFYGDALDDNEGKEQQKCSIVKFSNQILERLQDASDDTYYYVGRVNPRYGLEGSPFGNPFKMKNKSKAERVRVTDKFEE